jgi:cobalt-zinc-cadmium efflux system membrane fusion protein
MKSGSIPWVASAVVLVVVLAGWLGLRHARPGPQESPAAAGTASATATASASGAALPEGGARRVELSESQARAVEIAPIGQHLFAPRRMAVGSIDFNEDRSVQVFTPYQGKIIKAYAEVGQPVVKGQPLFTVDSPDLVLAESTLIAAAGVDDLTTAALARAKDLYANQGLTLKELQQASSDQQTAEGALKAARDALRVFGKSDADIDAIVARRKIDATLVVASPITGRVTARQAQPGLLVQPGNAPAPYSVADLSTVWMVANVTESDLPALRVGQGVQVKVTALPDRDFTARIAVIGATVDPATRTTQVRSEVADPDHALRPGMFASFIIQTGPPALSPAIPMEGVVREGDGTFTVWTTKDRRHFEPHTVRLGLQQEGFDQILEGPLAGELAVTKGAVLLSNLLDSPPAD